MFPPEVGQPVSIRFVLETPGNPSKIQPQHFPAALLCLELHLGVHLHSQPSWKTWRQSHLPEMQPSTSYYLTLSGVSVLHLLLHVRGRAAGLGSGGWRKAVPGKSPLEHRAQKRQQKPPVTEIRCCCSFTFLCPGTISVNRVQLCQQRDISE